jgi:hypothetical protein
MSFLKKFFGMWASEAPPSKIPQFNITSSTYDRMVLSALRHVEWRANQDQEKLIQLQLSDYAPEYFDDNKTIDALSEYLSDPQARIEVKFNHPIGTFDKMSSRFMWLLETSDNVRIEYIKAPTAISFALMGDAYFMCPLRGTYAQLIDNMKDPENEETFVFLRWCWGANWDGGHNLRPPYLKLVKDS